MEFRNYKNEYYDLLCDFLIEINKDQINHINWIWARLEWMIEHPYFNKDLQHLIGLWFDNDRIVGAAIYDMYLGEAFCGVLSEYKWLYKEALEYAFSHLKDYIGLGVAINDKNNDDIEVAKKIGFMPTKQTETMMVLDLNEKREVSLKKGLSFKDVDPVKDIYELEWLFWQGFDHGDDKEEFLKNEDIIPRYRKHYNPSLGIAVVNEKNEMVGISIIWYDKKTDYAYLEPVCVIPSYRKMGIAKAVIYENCNRVMAMGAKKVYVLSDFIFYEKIGFKQLEHFTFYYKNNVINVCGVAYKIIRELGNGKGGYSYLAESNNGKVVLKQIHHEPCDYYQFGNKLESEINDYNRLINIGIRMPKLIDIDKDKEIIIKEYIDGLTIFEQIEKGIDITKYCDQIIEMASICKNNGINIDYYPTNFISMNGMLYYIDYECNEYMEKWDYDNWGSKYWKKKE